MKIKQSTLFKEKCYVNGAWITAENQDSFSVYNPFNRETLGDVPNCGSKETHRAIEAANTAWLSWRETTAQERSTLLQRWASLIDEHQHDIATILTAEQGKPFAEAIAEIEYANSFIRWFSAQALRIEGDVFEAAAPNEQCLVIKQPVGVVAAITPWNFPAAMVTRKCAPALAAGCTIVLKPAEDTPLTALALAELAHQAGFPAGVINVITGNAEEIGKELCANPLVRKLSFTGSTSVGKLLMAQCASTVKKISLELGGNAPFIVFDDANPDAAITGLMAAKFRNSGQTCICPNRVFVQDKIFDVFLEKLTREVKKLRTGNGFENSVTLGPLINDAGISKVEALIEDALQKGAKLIIGQQKASKNSLFEPTILTEVAPSMQIFKEEIFGPVIALFRFKTEEEVIDLANNTPYGLAAYFYTENLHRAWRVAKKLESGMVGVNAGRASSITTPFGGVKQSGIGREGSRYGIEEYLENKTILMA